MKRALLLLASAFVPALAHAQPDQTTTEITERFNAPVFTTGALVFAGSYGGSVAVAGGSDHPGARDLYTPIVGPWVALDHWGSCAVVDPTCDRATADKVLLVADGVLQAAGLVAMIDGLFEPTHHRVVIASRRGVHVAPTAGGVLVFGHF